MPRSLTAEEWIEEIDEAVSEFENFTSTPAHKTALRDIFEEVESIAGRQALEELGETAIEVAEAGRHPKASRLRRYGRSIVVKNYDEDIPPGSTLLRSQN